MPALIHGRVALARAGDNPYVIARLKSGWVAIGDHRMRNALSPA